MLKTFGSTEPSTQPGEGVVGLGVDNRAGRGRREINGNKVDGGEVEVDEVGKKAQKTSKSKNSSKSQKMVGWDFLTPGAKLAFTKLRQAFPKAPIFHYFDPKCYIWIKTDASGYTIAGVLSQLTLEGQWHPVAFFSHKMIPAETRYKTHDGELLAIVEAFKTWRHYLEGSQHEVLVLTDHNNLHRLMDIKSLSSRQVRWAQELSRYHFQINYCQGKTNKAVDILSQYPQRSTEEEETLQAENVKILHCLQSLLAKVSGLLGNSSHLSLLHQVLICGTTVLP